MPRRLSELSTEERQKLDAAKTRSEMLQIGKELGLTVKPQERVKIISLKQQAPIKQTPLDILAQAAGISPQTLKSGLDITLGGVAGTVGEVAGAMGGGAAGALTPGPLKPLGIVGGALAGRAVGGGLGAAAGIIPSKILAGELPTKNELRKEFLLGTAFSGSFGILGSIYGKIVKKTAPELLNAIKNTPQETTELVIKSIEEGKPLPTGTKGIEKLLIISKELTDQIKTVKKIIGEATNISKYEIPAAPKNIHLQQHKLNLDLDILNFRGDKFTKGELKKGLSLIPKKMLSPKEAYNVGSDLVVFSESERAFPVGSEIGILSKIGNKIKQDIIETYVPKLAPLSKKYEQLIDAVEVLLPVTKRGGEAVATSKMARSIVQSVTDPLSPTKTSLLNINKLTRETLELSENLIESGQFVAAISKMRGLLKELLPSKGISESVLSLLHGPRGLQFAQAVMPQTTGAIPTSLLTLPKQFARTATEEIFKPNERR